MKCCNIRGLLFWTGDGSHNSLSTNSNKFAQKWNLGESSHFLSSQRAFNEYKYDELQIQGSTDLKKQMNTSTFINIYWERERESIKGDQEYKFHRSERESMEG